MQNIKVGRFIDDNGEALNDVEATLNKLGIQLRTSETEWRDIGEVLDEVGAKWDSFNNIEKSAITTALAATRQKNIMIATMGDYDRVMELANVSATSAGLSAEKYGHYLESIDAKINQLITTWESFIASINGSPMFAGIVDLGTSILTLLTNLDTLKVVLLALTYGCLRTFAFALSTLKADSSVLATALGKVQLVTRGTSTTVQELTMALEGLTIQQKINILVQEGYDEATIRQIVNDRHVTASTIERARSMRTLSLAEVIASISTKGLVATLKLLWSTLMANPLVAVITVLTTLISVMGIFDIFVNNFGSKFEDKITEILDKINSAKSELNRTVSQIEGVGESYATLSSKVNRTTEEQALFIEQSNKLAELLPDLVIGYDNNGNAVLNLAGSHDEVIASIEEEIEKMRELNNLQTLEQAPELFENVNGSINEKTKELEKAEKKLESLQADEVDALAVYDKDIGLSPDKVKMAKKNIKKGYQEMQATTAEEIRRLKLEIEKERKQIYPVIEADIELNPNYNDLDAQTQNTLKKVISNIDFDDLGMTTNTQMQQFINRIMDSVSSNLPVIEKKADELFKALQGEEITQAEYKRQIEELTSLLFNNEDWGLIEQNVLVRAFNSASFSGKSLEEVLKSLTPYIDRSSELFKDSLDFETAMTELNTQMDTYSSRVDEISKIYKTLNSGEKLSLDQLRKMIELYPDKIDAITDIINGKSTGIELTRILFEAEKQEILASLNGTKQKIMAEKEYYNTVEDTIAKLENRDPVHKDTLPHQPFEDSWIFGTGSSTKKGLMFLDNTSNKVKVVKEDTDSIRQRLAEIDALIAEVGSMTFDDIIVKTNASSSSSGSSTDLYKQEFENQLRELQYLRDKELITEQQYYDTLRKLTDTFFKDKAQYRDEYIKYDVELFNLQRTLAEDKINDMAYEIEYRQKTASISSKLDADEIKRYKELKAKREALAPDYGKGNVDLNHRPIVNNGDGSYSTVYSTTYTLKDGRAVMLTPILPNGKKLSAKELDNYFDNIMSQGGDFSKSDLFLGLFNNLKEADEYAEKLHESQALLYEDEANLLLSIENKAKLAGMTVDKYSAYIQSNSPEKNKRGQIAQYKTIQNEIARLAQQARANGLSEDSEYIQKLQDLWWSYEEKIMGLIDDIYTAQTHAIDDSLAELEIQQKYYEETSQEYIDLEYKKYEGIVNKKKILENQIAELRLKGTEDALEQVHELEDAYRELEGQRIDEILNLRQLEIDKYEAELEEVENQRDALLDLQDLTLQMLKEELEQQKKINDERIDGINEAFEAKKKLLEDEKNEHDYTRGLSEKKENVQHIQNQLDLVKNDETQTAKRLELEEQLTNALDELQEYQYQHSIEVQQNALDAQQEALVKKYENENEAYDKKLDNDVYLLDEANKLIETKDGTLYNKLIEHSRKYGTITRQEIEETWDNCNDQLADFNNNQLTVNETLDIMNDKMKDIKSTLKSITDIDISDYIKFFELGGGEVVSDIIDDMKSNSLAWHTTDDVDKKNELHEANLELKKKLADLMGVEEDEISYDSVSGKYMYNNVPIYHSGGFTKDISRPKSNELFAKLLDNEYVVTAGNMDRFMKSTLPSIVTSFISGAGGTIGDITIDNKFYVTGNTTEELMNNFNLSLQKSENNIMKKIVSSIGLKAGNMPNVKFKA